MKASHALMAVALLALFVVPLLAQDATSSTTSSSSRQELQAATRELQGTIDIKDVGKLVMPGLNYIMSSLNMPPLQDFLPPMEDMNLPSIDQFLNMTGLPAWDQLGLPPLSELLLPVGDFGSFNLPSVDDIIQQSNDTLNSVLKDLMPTGMKAPTIDLGKLVKNTKLPPLDSVLAALAKETAASSAANSSGTKSFMTLMANLEPLVKALDALPKIDLSTMDPSAPITLPPLDEILAKLPPPPQTLPSLDDMLKALGSLSS